MATGFIENTNSWAKPQRASITLTSEAGACYYSTNNAHLKSYLNYTPESSVYNGSNYDVLATWMSTINTSRTNKTKEVRYVPDSNSPNVESQTLTITQYESPLLMKLSHIVIPGFPQNEAIGMSQDSKNDIYEPYWSIERWVVRLTEENSGQSGYIEVCLNGNVFDYSVTTDPTKIGGNCITLGGPGRTSISTGIQYGTYSQLHFPEYPKPNPSEPIPGISLLIYPRFSTSDKSYAYRYFIDDNSFVVYKGEYWDQITIEHGEGGEADDPHITEVTSGNTDTPFYIFNSAAPGLNDFPHEGGLIAIRIPLMVKHPIDSTMLSTVTLKTTVISRFNTGPIEGIVEDVKKFRVIKIDFVVDDDIPEFEVGEDSITFNANASNASNSSQYYASFNVSGNVNWHVEDGQ